MPSMQSTIKKTITFSDVGIHTGVTTNMTLKPAKENTGIRFVRIDLDGNPVIKADIDNVFLTDRSTSLKNGDAEIHTVEHILAAISGNEIDNLIIEVDNIEIPILDGSSKIFAYEIQKTGKVIQNIPRKYFEIKRKISFIDEETGTTLVATPCEKYTVDVKIDYNSKTLGVQKASINSIDQFNTEIASSRTFCFLHELEKLLDDNLVKGCLLYTSPSPRDGLLSRMPSSA